MSDLKSQLEITANASGVEAGVSQAKRSLNSLGDAATKASDRSSRSIDNYVKKLEQQSAMLGKSVREMELYKLAQRGASDEQLKAADSALKLAEAYKRGEDIGARIKTGLIAGAAAATVMAGSMAALVIHSINAADHLNDLNKTTGLSVETLAGLSLAATQSGSDLDGIAASISRLSQNIGKDGDKFRALGITAKDPIEAFKQLSDIFSDLDDPQTRAALGAAALGKSWQSAAPLLSEGSTSIGEMIDKGARMSKVTTQLAQDADKFNDKLAELKLTASGFGSQIAGDMLPGLTKIISAIQSAYDESGKLNAAWVALGGLGAFLYTDEFASTSTKIKNLKSEIDALSAELETRAKAPFVGLIPRLLFGDSDDELRKQLAAKQAQVNELLKSLQPSAPTPPKAPTSKATKDKVNTFIGGNTTERDTAAQEAKARLTFDLEQIKKSSDATTNAYANAERIMQARRAANLVDDQTYYAAKLSFLNLNTQAQESALQGELDRLQQEKLAGKDKIDNDRKIVDVQARLAKVRSDSAANAEILGIQEADYFDRIKRGYIEAEAAARAYLDTTNQQYARELAGIGQGAQNRDRNAGIAQIEDKYAQQRLQLESDKRQGAFNGREADYQQELDRIDRFQAEALASYTTYYDALIRKQGDWSLGASEALQNYADESRNVFKQTETVVGNAMQGMEDALVKFVTTGKLSFTDLANSIVADITRIIIKQQISNSLGVAGGSGGDILGSIVGSLVGDYKNATGDFSAFKAIAGGNGRAAGGPVSAGGLYRVSEDGPEVLNVGNKQYLMMGNQAGSVTPNSGIASGGTSVVVNNSFVVGNNTDARTQQQIATMAGDSIRRAMARNA